MPPENRRFSAGTCIFLQEEAFFCRKMHFSAGKGIFLQENTFLCRKTQFCADVSRGLRIMNCSLFSDEKLEKAVTVDLKKHPAQKVGTSKAQALSTQGSRQVCLSLCLKAYNAKHFTIRSNFPKFFLEIFLGNPEFRERKTHKHKQICGIVPGLGGCQKFVYVFFWVIPYGGAKTHKQNSPKNPGTIP